MKKERRRNPLEHHHKWQCSRPYPGCQPRPDDQCVVLTDGSLEINDEGTEIAGISA